MPFLFHTDTQHTVVSLRQAASIRCVLIKALSVSFSSHYEILHPAVTNQALNAHTHTLNTRTHNTCLVTYEQDEAAGCLTTRAMEQT